ncbi:hypothetical protein F2P56_022943, partial [Juglans regia]
FFPFSFLHPENLSTPIPSSPCLCSFVFLFFSLLPSLRSLSTQYSLPLCSCVPHPHESLTHRASPPFSSLRIPTIKVPSEVASHRRRSPPPFTTSCGSTSKGPHWLIFSHYPSLSLFKSSTPRSNIFVHCQHRSHPLHFWFCDRQRSTPLAAKILKRSMQRRKLRGHMGGLE